MAVPIPSPVTMPVLLTEPIVLSLLLHVPPPVASVSVIVNPKQTLDGPLIAAGATLTVTGTVAMQLPPVE